MYAVIALPPDFVLPSPGLNPIQMILVSTPPVVPTVAQPERSSSVAIGVCLDYAMGTCTRNHCKYPHPDPTPLHRMREQYGHQGVVCEVYALTGHCRFGAKCTKMHPATDAPLEVPPQSPLPPTHVSSHPETVAQPNTSPSVPTSHVPLRHTPDAMADDQSKSDQSPSEERRASLFDAFATDMHRSMEKLEGHPPVNCLPTPAPAAIPAPNQDKKVLPSDVDELFLDIIRDLREICH